MKKSLFILAFASSLLFACDCDSGKSADKSVKCACDSEKVVVVKDAYARATPPGVKNSAAFMEVKNNSDKDISLLSATSDVSDVAELHNHGMKDGVMKMYQVPKIDIKAKSSTLLKPGAYHVMLIGLKNKALKEGEKVKLVLKFSNGKEVEVVAPVKKVMAGMKMMKKHHDMKDMAKKEK